MRHRKIVGLLALIAAVAVPAWAQQAPSEEDYADAMRSIQSTTRAVGGHMDAQDATALGGDGDKLVAAFETINTFWESRNEEAAKAMALTALTAARKFQMAGAAGNFDAAGTAFGEVRGTCQSCHRQYRERTENGYRIKQGG